MKNAHSVLGIKFALVRNIFFFVYFTASNAWVYKIFFFLKKLQKATRYSLVEDSVVGTVCSF
jgi:hypothetical protein